MLFNSIAKKLLIPTLLLVVILFASMGVVMVRNSRASIGNSMASKGNAQANLLKEISPAFYATFDFSTLEKFVKETLKDPEVVFTVFYDENRQPITNSVKEPADASQLLIYEREINDDGGKIIGFLKTGYSKEKLSDELKRGIITVVSTIAVSTVLLIIGIIFLVNRFVSSPINCVVEMLKDIATGEGDLTKKITSMSRCEVGELSNWFNTFVGKIHDMIVQISQTALNAASASENLSASAVQIAKGTKSQMEKAAQVAASSEEMSATVIEVTKNSSSASEAAKNSNKIAQKGKDIVERTVSGMDDITMAVKESASLIKELGARSNEIGEIIKVIDDIADQTNLLALNAAIEAARAGEHGRGFAVVADEVRKLAEKTTKATKEIGGMIHTIQDETNKAVMSMGVVTNEVEDKARLTKDAGDALLEIVSNADKLTGMIQQIAVASEEESAAIDQISKDIQDIANTTKETANSSNHIAEASSNLSRLASELQSLLSKFKIKGGDV
ncbi:MAG: methyl-accepting chemotaxis protein [Nitrospinae bacterium]|nr:methyl-accepting chemotaxis protein [Nitrospinota bacterium]